MGSPRNTLTKFNDKVRPYAVWLLRLAIGGIFVFSGFVKSVDPWGFVIKINEYLSVWGIDWLWRETVICIAVAIALAEFCIGIMLVSGSLRRTVSIGVLLMMAVMLPLTLYIVIVSPVEDCGCFGDAYIISNTASFVKNVLITLGAVYLLFNNQKVTGLYPPLMQWMPMLASLFYCLILAFVGFSVQPMVDFRPYKVGQPIIEDENETVQLVYAKDGVEETFEMDALPDSTWTYVRRKVAPKHDKVRTLAIYDGDDDVTDYVMDSSEGQLILAIPDPSLHQKARASMANNLNDYITIEGGNMICLLGGDKEQIDHWKSVAHPNFDTYTADPTALRTLVRGDAGLVYVYDDTIRWKRNLYSLAGDFPDFTAKDDQLLTVSVVDDGHDIKNLTLLYISIMLALLLLGQIRTRKR